MLDSIRLLLIKSLGRRRYEQIIFLLKNYYLPNQSNPESFNEIISKRKLGDYSPLMVQCADKLKVRQFVQSHIGQEYLTQLYNTTTDTGFTKDQYDNFPDKFVLKSNYGSGDKFIKIVKNKLDISYSDLNKWTLSTFSKVYGKKTLERWYMDIEPQCVIVEELLNPSGEELRDYKFIMVNQKVFFIQVDQDRFTNHTRNLYSVDWDMYDFSFGYPIGAYSPPPSQITKMIDIAQKLSKPFDFCRIDLYQDEFDRIKFGEITFSPDAGWGRFSTKVDDFRLGKQLSSRLRNE